MAGVQSVPAKCWISVKRNMAAKCFISIKVRIIRCGLWSIAVTRGYVNIGMTILILITRMERAVVLINLLSPIRYRRRWMRVSTTVIRIPLLSRISFAGSIIGGNVRERETRPCQPTRGILHPLLTAHIPPYIRLDPEPLRFRASIVSGGLFRRLAAGLPASSAFRCPCPAAPALLRVRFPQSS